MKPSTQVGARRDAGVKCTDRTNLDTDVASLGSTSNARTIV